MKKLRGTRDLCNTSKSLETQIDIFDLLNITYSNEIKLIPTKENEQGVIKVLCPKIRDFFSYRKLPCQFLPLNVFRNT